MTATTHLAVALIFGFVCVSQGFVRVAQRNTRTSTVNLIPNLQHTSRLAPMFSGVEVDVNALPDSKRRIAELKTKVENNLSKDVLNLGNLRGQVKDMEQESSQPEFWDDQDKAQKLLSELNRLKALVARVEGWQTSCEDVETLLEMANEDPNGSGTPVMISIQF